MIALDLAGKAYMTARSVLPILAGMLVLASCVGSPGQRDILFVRRAAGPDAVLRIWRMGADGSNPRPFTTDTAGLGNSNTPDWSPDGRRVAFTSQVDGSRLAIFVANADGSGLTELSAGDQPFAFWPAWSPDGKEILFNAGPSPFEQDLFIMNADGTDTRQITSAEGMEYCGRWSPDGTHIVFTWTLADTTRLIVTDREGRESGNLLPSSFEAHCGDWSPDGHAIAFSSPEDHDIPSISQASQRAGSTAIHVFDLDNEEVTQLTRLRGMSDRPRWSRDGRRIVFHSSESVGTIIGTDPRVAMGLEIYAMNADGSSLQRLTENEWFDGHPVW